VKTREAPVDSIRLDAEQLRVRPANDSLGDYTAVYRDASSVRWDEQSREFYVLPSARLDTVGQFKQILGAVQREYGRILRITPETRFVNVTGNNAAALKQAALEE
jgi:hypothetical protein